MQGKEVEICFLAHLCLPTHTHNLLLKYIYSQKKKRVQRPPFNSLGTISTIFKGIYLQYYT